jgi:hypothetical protein
MVAWRPPDPRAEFNGWSCYASKCNAKPAQKHSDVELGTWASLAATDTDNSTSQEAKICKSCMPEFCAAAAFTGNPDIGGIGVSFEHPSLRLTFILISNWVGLDFVLDGCRVGDPEPFILGHHKDTVR